MMVSEDDNDCSWNVHKVSNQMWIYVYVCICDCRANKKNYGRRRHMHFPVFQFPAACSRQAMPRCRHRRPLPIQKKWISIQVLFTLAHKRTYTHDAVNARLPFNYMYNPGSERGPRTQHLHTRFHSRTGCCCCWAHTSSSAIREAILLYIDGKNKGCSPAFACETIEDFSSLPLYSVPRELWALLIIRQKKSLSHCKCGGDGTGGRALCWIMARPPQVRWWGSASQGSWCLEYGSSFCQPDTVESDLTAASVVIVYWNL